MGFKADLAADVARILSEDELAVSVEYRGAQTSALVEFDEEWADGATSVRNMLVLTVSAGDVPAPRNRDDVVVLMPDGTERTWYVDRIAGGDGFVWRLICYEQKRPKL